MKNMGVPAPPMASWETASKSPSSQQQPLAASVSHRLDAAFLCRLYRSVALVAIIATLFALMGTWSKGVDVALGWTSSFGFGALLGVVLLRSQGWIISRALRVPDANEKNARKINARALVWLLVPLKYLLVMLALGVAVKSGGLNLFAFGGGFFIVQMAIFAKIVGLVLASRVRTVRETFITRDS